MSNESFSSCRAIDSVYRLAFVVFSWRQVLPNNCASTVFALRHSLPTSEGASMNQELVKSAKLGDRLSLKRGRLTFHGRSKKAGLPPGSLVHIGTRSAERVTISAIDYGENEFHEKEISDAQDLAPYLESRETTWIRVQGLQQTDIIEAVGSFCKVHPLFLEDIVNTSQRPKAEDAGDYFFIIIRMLSYDDRKNSIVTEQLSLVLATSFLLSFEEKRGRIFDSVMERIKAGKGRIRKGGTDYLAYCLIDTVVDDYFGLLERLGEKIELLEEDLVTNPTPEILSQIHSLKVDMIFLRRSVWPLREVINQLSLGESNLIKESSRPYFRDVYDHTIHIIDTMETYRDIVSGMLDIYLSSVSYRLNEIMKILTIIATIFIPLTFLVGWYGMNFKHMPEFDWRWGYPMVIVVAITTAAGLVLFFRRRKWL
jgi:magnesium transporter